MAPIMLECEKRGLKWRWIYTAQHKDTIAQSIETFSLPNPDYTVVNWNTEAKTLGKFFGWFGKMLWSLTKSKKILDGYTGKDHIVLTHGDTTTTWIAALYGRLTRTKVMHIEAGFRSGHYFNPFPEEINRIITSRFTDYHMCPGEELIDNLKHRKGKKVNTVYNTQVDTLDFGLIHCEDVAYKIPKGKYVVVSLHRYENIFKKERMEKIILLLQEISKQFPTKFVLHPATEGQLNKLNLRKKLESTKNIELLPRLEYLPFIKLIKHSEFMVTDGGGNLEELHLMGKPTLVFRNVVEHSSYIGDTAELSMLEKAKVVEFLKEYKKYEKPRIIPKHSPSAMCVDLLKPYG
ncbi:UDP-N-acetylglucosamine 2-epimerase [Candidatus Saccharibacteria bacterium]|nr:UDP-N-acetylglucosamine 2-epimerase [Candidatus Saccharibacteria bacterium]